MKIENKQQLKRVMVGTPSDHEMQILNHLMTDLKDQREHDILNLLKKVVGVGNPVTEQEFAELTYINKKNVGNYLNNKTHPTPFAIKRIAYGLAFFWEILEDIFWQDEKKMLIDKGLVTELNNPLRRQEAEEKLQQQFVALFGIAGQNAVKIITSEKWHKECDAKVLIKAQLYSLYIQTPRGKNKYRTLKNNANGK